ncbi:MAG: 3-deoxy-7-phosphoheptulonate synthase [Bdellovibrionota bacterium]
MIVVMKAGSSQEQLDNVIKNIEAHGYRAHVMYGVERNVIGCLGDERGKEQLQSLELLSGVERVVPILSSYKLANRQLKHEPTVVKVSENCIIGGDNIAVIAGPCSVESEEQIVNTAKLVAAAGANALRGGAFKPRSSTYAFQGLGEEGLKMLRLAKQETGLPIVTEIMDHHMLDLVVEYADVLQVGARNMQNFSLLRSLGEVKKPILLKRGLAATVEELIQSAEYILAAGNPDVILCERGIRTYETATRNTLDLNAVPALQERTHLPVIVDPSHGTGVYRYVAPLSKAAVAVGASGLMIEVHPKPAEALSDGAQSLKPAKFEKLMSELRVLGGALGKTVGRQ